MFKNRDWSKVFRVIEAFKNINWSKVVRITVVLLMVAFAAWFTSKALGGFINGFMSGRQYLIEFLVIFIAAGYFPLTYIAYQSFRHPIRIIRLRTDFHFLGYQEEEADRLYTHSQDPWSYCLYIALTMLLTIIGMGLVFWPTVYSNNSLMFVWPSLNASTVNNWITPNTVNALRYGFLGAYVFSVYLIYRRYTTDDLQPTVYLNSALTMIAGLVFNYVAFEALFKLAQSESVTTATGIEGGIFAILAFALGYFPNLALRWFSQIAYSAFKVDPRYTETLPLSHIDGISQWHEARLRDNGIDNIQNLAAVEIRDLLVSTTFDAQEVVDWVDQAILYLYLDPGEINSFRRAGIRLISDFHKLCDINKIKDKPDKKTNLENLAKQLQITPERLETLYNATQSGPNLHRVLDYWSHARLHSRQLQDQLVEEFKVLDDLVASARDTGPELLPDMKKLLNGVGNLLSHAIENPRPHARVSIGNLYALCAGQRYKDSDYRAKALKCYTQAIDDEPNYARAYSQRAMIHYYSHQPLLALADYEKAVTLIPDRFPGNHNNLAWIYAHENKPPRLDKALVQAQKAVDISAEQNGEADPAYLDTLAGIQLLLAEKEQKPDKKLKLLNQAFKNLQRIQFGPRIPDYGRIEIVKNQENLVKEYLKVMEIEEVSEKKSEICTTIESMITGWMKLAKIEPFETTQKHWQESKERLNREEQDFKDFRQLAQDTASHILKQIKGLGCWPEDHQPTLEKFSNEITLIQPNGKQPLREPVAPI